MRPTDSVLKLAMAAMFIDTSSPLQNLREKYVAALGSLQQVLMAQLSCQKKSRA
jgi:hypothetical protein